MERVLIGNSPIVIGRALRLSELLAPRSDGSTAAVITQPGAKNIAQSVATDLKHADLDAHVMVLPEARKDLRAAEAVYEWLRQLRLTRQDLVVAVGGGAATDLAGFVASTYLRGVDAVYVPTTLLGAVDAAVGGKTALDFGAKNLIGTFQLPILVAIDLDTLDAIPPELRTDGLAEVAKTALIADESLLEALETHGPALEAEQMVGRCVKAKAGIVSSDLREAGQRAVLNYGHTVGHAIEVSTGLAHGKAISVGMEAAASASASVSDFEDAPRQTELLAGLGLPVRAPADPEQLVELMALDKKRASGATRMVLLRALGDPVVADVDDATVSAALTAVTETK